MMLRYIYFLSLLLCISLSKEEFLRSGKRYPRKCIRDELSQSKINRKRKDYDMFDDKEPVAHIDVASFIQNPDDTSINSQLLDNRRQAIKDYADDALRNADIEDEADQSQDYQSLESDSIPEVNIYNRKHIPQYVNINAQSTEGIDRKHLYKTDDIKIRDNMSFNSNRRHHTHAEKKCALKNMKIPFFSRDKATTTKTKKNKKRKLFGFRKEKKNSSVTKMNESNFNNIRRIPNEEPKKIKVDKRSYFERLCPACKEKFIFNSNVDFIDKFRRTANNVIHNSRQYYQNKKSGDVVTETNEPNNYQVKHQNDVNENIDSNYRWKRNDVDTLKRNKNYNE